jgi:hypothetical protein
MLGNLRINQFCNCNMSSPNVIAVLLCSLQVLEQQIMCHIERTQNNRSYWSCHMPFDHQTMFTAVGCSINLAVSVLSCDTAGAGS